MSTRRQSRRITVESPVDIDVVTVAINHHHNTEVAHHFPYKLYDMLEYAADSEYSSSVSWLEDGMSFAINNKDIFMEFIVPLFFKQTKFRSFTRQLNLWGFTRDTNSGAWQHEDFIRGRVERLQFIERVENKSKVIASTKKTSIKPSVATATRSSSRKPRPPIRRRVSSPGYAAQQLKQTFKHIMNKRSQRHKKHVDYSEDKDLLTQEEESNNTTNMSPLQRTSSVEDNEDTPEDYNSIPSLQPLVESTSPVEHHSTNIISSGNTFEDGYPPRYSLLTDETDILYKMASSIFMNPWRDQIPF